MRALVVLLLAGCWHDVPPPPLVPATDTSTVADDDPPITRRHRGPSGPDCSALRPMMEQLFNRSGFQNQIAQVLDAVTASCVEDAWSMELIECFASAKDTSTAEACARQDGGLLSLEQMESLQKRLMLVLTNAAPSTPSP